MEARVRKFENPKIVKNKAISVNNKVVLKAPIARTKKKPKLKNLTLIRYMILVLAMFISGTLVLTGYANITKNKSELQKLDRQIAELDKQLTSLSGKIETLKTDANIVEEAQYKLGMVYPEESQIVYFTFEDGDIKEQNVDRPKIIEEIQAMIKSFTDSF